MHPPRGCGGVRGGAVGTQAARRRYTAVNEDHAMSPDAVSDAAVIRRYRRALIPMIAAALPLPLAGWLALYWLPPPLAGTENPGSRLLYALGDRKSVVSGKRVSVRVDLGGRRIIKQKQTPKKKK